MRCARQALRTICRGGIVLGAVVGMMHADSVFAHVETGGATSRPQAARAHTPLQVNQTAQIDGLDPGRPAQTLAGTFDNRNPAPVRVATVRVSIDSVSKAPGAAEGPCDAGDFTLGHRTMRVGADVPRGRGTGAWSGATIAFANRAGVDQNACMGAAVTLRYTVA
jgi:hypothetical protein